MFFLATFLVLLEIIVYGCTYLFRNIKLFEKKGYFISMNERSESQ